MYSEYEGGSKIELQGLEINLPPVGYVWDEMKDELVHTGVKHLVANTYSNPLKQKWKRQPLPDWYEDAKAEEDSMKEDDPNYQNPRISEYVDDQWFKRLNGMWFWNKGEATFITGLHWFYLNWWFLDGHYPDYRETDKEFFYCWKYVEQDPRCMGMIEVTMRRQGKTFRSGCMGYEYASSHQFKHVGIQSKTEEDAKRNVFGKAVISPFNKLPDFWIPVFDTSSGTRPTKTLRFFRPKTRGKNAVIDSDKIELESWIDAESSKPTAYDGKRLDRYICDESGKDKDNDVAERHEINKWCCVSNNQIIGKMLYTTTVEEMTAGGEAFKILWDRSDQRKKNPVTGQTDTMLYQYFLPAHRGTVYDEWGHPDVDNALEEINALREQYSKSPKLLASYMRKNPLRIEEAFYTDSSRCLFNAYNLEMRREVLFAKKNLWVRGNLVWENNERFTNVKFVEAPNGRFKAALIPEEKDRNCVLKSGLPRPKNMPRFVAACDPYAMNVTADVRADANGNLVSFGSRAAAYVLQRPSVMRKDSVYDGAPIIQYLSRPQHINIFYEDMVKMCWYFGCEILIENNRDGLLEYFKDNRMENFLMWLPEKPKPGIASSQYAKQEMAYEVEMYVEDSCDKIFFVELIESLLKFDIQNTEKYDAVMAFGWLLIANRKHKPVEMGSDMTDVSRIFRRRKIRV